MVCVLFIYDTPYPPYTNFSRGPCITFIDTEGYIIDWNYDEDRSRISTGYGPEDMTRFRLFAISIIKSKGLRSVAQKMRQLTRNTRLVFDYLRMTKNSCATKSAFQALNKITVIPVRA